MMLPFLQQYTPDSIILHHAGGMWGLGCPAGSQIGWQRLNDVKGDRRGKPYITLLPGLDWLERYGMDITSRQKLLLEQYWPGELTVVLKCPRPPLPELAPDGTMAVRVPTPHLLRRAMRMMESPLLSTSVNQSGEPPLNDLSLIRRVFAGRYDMELPGPALDTTPVPSTLVDMSGHSLRLLREGSIPFGEIVESATSPKILFICSANIVRSPLAEYLARHMIQQRGLDLRVESAGELDISLPMNSTALRILAEKGIDGSHHMSHPVTWDTVRSSRWIICMEERQRKRLIAKWPQAIDRICTLRDVSGEHGDIPDPMEYDYLLFARIVRAIEERVEILVDKIAKKL